MPEPPFSLEGSRHDLHSYWGRVQHFREVTDVRTLFVGVAELELAQQRLAAFRAGRRGTLTDAQLWEARRIKESMTRPQAQNDHNAPQLIPALFRFAAFAPVNIPLCAALIYPGSVSFAIGAQWLNQTYNAGVNYANRGVAPPGQPEANISRLATAYVGAVGSSCGLAFGLGALNKRAQHILAARPLLAAAARGVIPYTAVAVAGVLNVTLMRLDELQSGLPLIDAEGQNRGSSVLAARDALTKCSLARVIWSTPIILFPPLAMAALDRAPLFKRWFARQRGARAVTELGVLTGLLWAVLPLAIAVFPQQVTLPVDRLEAPFRNLTDKAGQPITHLTFNKGL